MEKTEGPKRKFGLIGKNIDYSFSRGYFREKFLKLGLENYRYDNYELDDISQFTEVLEKNPHLAGLNVTIPYKETIIPYLDSLDPVARDIGAVNTVKKTPEGLIGYNTDAFGFEQALLPFLKANHKKALILGTGGASKAVAYVLDKLRIDYLFVSRRAGANQLAYSDMDQETMATYHMIINCTPLGTWPDVEAKPMIPYAVLNPHYLLFDLIYNPEKTAFLEEGEKRGATISNGLKMLELQADRAWEIWNS
ncbi:shikimate dehydrogenase family protein [Lentiprolixibacter aurantiacus]|uniref:Shikimate dehydrogenase n=1 Tax=Lentiprolixibacter aurantiacus TaxID=2993939 RepID=A0AAE3MN12_9FLAO|nr:shikimate dehydrogenase [Lentiprolixibacter aurantiacus]MCX2720439.1 shikimate dehydrogenase [Lentiprolixibacter aurantiacus]